MLLGYKYIFNKEKKKNKELSLIFQFQKEFSNKLFLFYAF